MRLFNGVIVLVVLVTCKSQEILQQTCSSDGSWVNIQFGAQAMVGGLICSQPYVEMQSYEAVRFVFDLLNKENQRLNGEFLNSSYVPGIKLGMRVNDVCTDTEAAIAGATELFPQLSSGSTDCRQAPDSLMLGVIGTSASGTSMSVAKYLEKFNIPIISYEASAPSLSDNQMYPTFMRTVPPDGPLMDVIIEVLNKLNWKYLVVIYEDTVFGRASYEAILPRLTVAGICLTSAIRHGTTDTVSNTLERAIITGTTGVIYFGGQQLASDLLDQAENIADAGKLQWIFTDSLSFNKDFSTKTYQRGVISVVPTSRFIVEFEDHWVRIDENNPSPENPWFKQWYMEQNQCRLNGFATPANWPVCQTKTEREKRISFNQNPYVEPAFHAVFTYAYALRAAHRDECGENAVGMCDDLKKLDQATFFTKYLREVDFIYSKEERVPSLASDQYAPYFAAKQVKFDANGDILNPSYDIWNYNDISIGGSSGEEFRRVGTFINGRLDINLANVRMYSEDRKSALPSVPASLCATATCGPCLGVPPETKYFFQDGDVIITGLFSLHNKGVSPLTCGAFDEDKVLPGVQFLQGMIYALYKVIQNNDILRGVRLGGLAFDDCKSPTLGTTVISQVQQGTLMIQDKLGNRLDPRKVDGYTAAHTISQTYPIAELMNIFKRPLVSYASPDDDLLQYPYYLRSTSGSTFEKRAVIKMLKYLGYKYVQVVYEDYEYFRKGNAIIRKLAAEEGICVVSTVTLGSDGGETVEKLRNRKQVAPVILNVLVPGVRRFLQGIKDKNASGEFAIFGLHTFGDDMNVVQGYEDVANGVVSLTAKHSTLAEYQLYLSGLRVNTVQDNPWFAEWYQHLHQCRLPDSDIKMYTTVCPDIDTIGIPGAQNYTLSYYTEAAIHAVYAFAYGLNSTLNHYCGAGFSGVCDEYRIAKDKGEILVEKIKEVNFIPENAPYAVRFYDKVVDQPLSFYNFINGQFVEIAEYENMNNRLTVRQEPVMYNNLPASHYMPNCSRICVECFYMFQSQDYMYIEGDLLVPAVFDVHYSAKGPSPFYCGNLRVENSFQYLEAFAFALDFVNSGRASVGLNNNLRLGGLAFDGCMNALRATTITNAFQSSAIMFKDSDGKIIDNRKTLAWLGYDSQSTINMAEILGSMGIPVVTPAATSPTLNDKDRFHSFFRTIPSEDIVAKGMADLSKSLGFDYVITVNAPNTAMREARDMYARYMKGLGLCVLASYEFETESMNIILDSMNQSTTRVVALFAEPDQYVTEMLRLKASRYPNTQFIFISNRRFDRDRKNFGRHIEKSISFDMMMPTIDQFRDYLATLRPDTNKRNPWFKEYYEAKNNCQLTKILSSPPVCGSSNSPIIDSNFQQDLYVLSTINAVYALTEGVHKTLEEKCGNGYTTICGEFLTSNDTNQRVMIYMDQLNYTDITNEFFYFIRREANRGFKITQYLNFGEREVATLNTDVNINYLDERDLRNDYRNVMTTCTDNCAACLDSDNNFGDFTHVIGDIYLVGLFDVHKKGATPYTCGEINTKHGVQLLEAFNYAVEYVNNKTGMFSGKLGNVIIGAIGLDVCQNPTRAANLVSNIHSQNVKLRDPIDNSIINPSRFDVYVGPFDTESSIRVADVLDALSIPQITYGATSLELQDPKKYRYFLRTVPADDKQARAIISYLKRFENNFVQIISSFDSVGLKGKEEFMRLAPLNKICVEKEIVVGLNGPITVQEASSALNKLMANTTDGRARTVVLFVDDPRVILQMAETNQQIRENFFFIGTDKWGFDTDMLVGLDRLLENRKAVTFDIETADIPGFDKHMEFKTPKTYTSNPWFKEYYEREFKCNMDPTATKYNQQCTDDMLGVSRSPDFIQDPYALYVINAVFSAALGIHKSLIDNCADASDPTQYYSGVCGIFRRSGKRREIIYRGIKQVEFMDDTEQPFYYLPSGESDRGYHVYEPRLQQTPKAYYYDNVGSYNDTDYLKLDITYDINFKSRCTEGVDCPCVFPKYEPSRYMLQKSQFSLNLVYLADVHMSDPNDPYQCGKLSSMSNFQSLLAFFFAINQVNANSDNRFPATLKLGGLALDTCSQPMRIGEDVYSLLSGEGLCRANGNGQIISPASIVSFHALTTTTSIPLSRILTPYKILSLSPGATSVQLNDKRLHPYFLRTVPPDNIQVLLMLEVMKKFNWDYASLIYTNSAYGISARDALIERAAFANLKTCIAMAYAISSETTVTQAEEILVRLSQLVGARVVILFTEPAHSRLLLQAAKNKGLRGRFVWLASDYWANNMEIVQGYEEEAVGAITVQIRSEFVQSFNHFMTNLTLTSRHGVPDDWFEELYQTIHRCRLLDSQVKTQFPRVCSGQERITENMINQDPFVLHTIIAVYQIAEGLNNIASCRASGLDVFACLSLKSDRRQLIYNSVQGTQFSVLQKELADKSFDFKFTAEGYGDIGYNILNFHRDVTQDRYVYSKIGLYQESLTIERLSYRGVSILTVGVIPLSTCPNSINCTCYGGGALINAGGAFIGAGSTVDKLVVAGGGSTYQYVHIYSSTGLIQQDDGTFVNAETGALLLGQSKQGGSDRFYNLWGIIVAALAGIGAFIVLCMFVYLLVVYPVRSGTTILGFLLLFGCLLMYLLVFAFIFHASPVVCAFRKFALGFVYALVYAVLFVKLVDCWRSRKAGDYSEVKYSKMGRPLGLFFLVIMLVLVQVIICAEWLILVSPGFTYISYNQMIWPLCSPVGWYDAALVLSLVYVMLLIILCVIFGFACFSSPRNHYESRWILGIAILSIPTWVIWCLVAVLSGYKFRDAAVCVGLLLNATYILLCGPLRKLYLLNKYQALIDEEEKEMEKEKKSIRGSQYSYSAQYDNRPQFHGSMHGSVHGSVHGSRHGTLQSRNGYGYMRSERGQMVLVQGGGHGVGGHGVGGHGGGGHGGGRLYSTGSSVHNGGEGMVLVRDSRQDDINYGHGSVRQGFIHTGDDIGSGVESAGHYNEVYLGDSGMVMAGGSAGPSGNGMVVASGSGMETGPMGSGLASGGHYSEVGNAGGVSVSQAFGSRADVYQTGFTTPNISYKEHSQYEVMQGHSKSYEYEIGSYDFDDE